MFDDHAVLRIGARRVDPTINEISCPEQTLRLEPRTMRLLLCLAANAGRVVELQRLLDEVWAGVVVTPGSVYQAIAQLRRLLGDDPEKPSYIDTVPRKGYRLIAAVEPWVEETDAAAGPRAGSASGAAASAAPGPAPAADVPGGKPPRAGIRPRGRLIAAALIGAIIAAAALVWFARFPPREGAPRGAAAPERAIAVLPFLDLSERHDDEYFALGMAEEIIDRLVKIPQLKVIAHTSSFQFKDRNEDLRTVGAMLGVPYLLEGSVRRSGIRVRVTAQLIRAADRYHLWSNTYDRELKDVFSVQDEIAGAVVGALRLKLVLPQRLANTDLTPNPEAYQAYLVGRQFYYAYYTGAGDNFQHAREAFRQAISLDPNYAAAYAALAGTEAYLAEESPDKQPGLERALQAADKAVALAPDLGDGYAARGFIRATWIWDWTGAETDVRKALALDPGTTEVQRRFAIVMGNTGRLPEAIAAAKRATELDPLIEGNWLYLGFFLNADGQYAAARNALKRAVSIGAESRTQSRFYLGVTELLDGHRQAALEAFRQSRNEALRSAGIALAEHSLGHTAESKAALDELMRKHAGDSAYFIAAAYAWAGDGDLAFAWLDRAYSQREIELSRVKVDPLLARLHGDRRFTALMQKMGFAEGPRPHD